MNATWIGIAIAVFSLLTLLFITLPLLRRGLRDSGREERTAAKRVLTVGTSARAVIRSIEPTNARLGGEPVVILELDVLMTDGSTRRIDVRTAIHSVHIPAFQPGQEINVKYEDGAAGFVVAVEGAYLP
ncbi:hypothetical protein [Paenibacillus sp. PAMC21692]|uniref:hypothetical protein n=1 Tax=Paenibacillus sp. PAMC21692 TaxID=2762320 RepID=UPI00164CDF32|nr:hypothetical protein [Paenibacillus sp. PAMC21692]QNK56880.1 hypothetical protein H7F31_30945 [Paenibacillus sp. PAMC21692]